MKLALLAIALTYAGAAFARWQLNPALWPEDTRTTAVVIAACAFVVTLAATGALKTRLR